jgi:hypothetical protein
LDLQRGRGVVESFGPTAATLNHRHAEAAASSKTGSPCAAN